MWAVLRLLIGRIGWLNSVRVLGLFLRWQWSREPFGGLPPAEDDRERQSRAQIAPAILLYRALKRRAPESAWELTESVVLMEGVRFLRKSLGRLELERLQTLSPVERREFVEIRGAKFFNATLRWDEVAADRVQFTVTSCRFPPLCVAAGVPELAPMFCRVDDAYFGKVEPGVTLERPATLAGGQDHCLFKLSIRDHGESSS